MNRIFVTSKALKYGVTLALMSLIGVTSLPTPLLAEIIADHTRIGAIPASAVALAKSTLHIAYGHTSHGSQLVTGMSALYAHDPLYAWSSGGTGGALDLRDGVLAGDVGYYPAWVDYTKNYLGTPVPSTGRGSKQPLVNVVIWSWCGQASSLTQQQMITNYLTPMTQLEAQYPGVKFVYMTGHLDGTGTSGNLHQRNEQIRAHVRGTNRILFDFADIESYDPNREEFLSRRASDECYYDSNNDGYSGYLDRNWAVDWVAANPSNELTHLATTHCGDCAHSQKLNCIMKGRAVWWLWAKIAGWNGDDKVRIENTPYATLNDAYLHAQNGNVLKARATDFTENLEMQRDIDVTIRGGYDDQYSLTRSGYATLAGSLMISGGSLVADQLVVR